MRQFMISTGCAALTVLMVLMSNVGQAASKDGNVTAATTPIKASNEKAAAVCAACHGANGVSVAAHIPNLAGQKAAYLEAQLGAFKEGSRKNEIMNAIAAQLRDEDIASLAAYFSTQSVSASAKSAFLPNLARTNVRFPADYKSGFRLYHTINDADSKQVKLHYANQIASAAVKAGRPLPDGASIFVEIYSAKLDSDKKPMMGKDALFVPDRLLSYAAMSRNAGWGNDIPEMLRNENWNYAIFSADRQLHTTINQAECLACHKPERNSSYVFTLKHM
jgi:cytochrome c553